MTAPTAGVRRLPGRVLPVSFYRRDTLLVARDELDKGLSQIDEELAEEQTAFMSGAAAGADDA